MTAQARRRSDSLAPALIAALAMHVGLFVALTVFHPAMPLPLGAAVPINIVSQAPTTDSRKAEPAPRTQTAQVEEPVPQAPAPSPPPPPPPEPPARPAPPKPLKTVPPPKPALKPAPAKPTPVTPAKPQPAVARPSRAPPKDTFDLNALAASISRAAKSSPARPANAARGPTRAETAPVERVDAGQGIRQSDIAGLSQLLDRLWLKNCDSGTVVNVTVRLAIDNDGRVLLADAGGREHAGDPAASASAIRAIAAVHQAAPYAEEFRGRTFTVNFDAAKACANR
jgi:type IV secretory pathway VirB10-like protein